MKPIFWFKKILGSMVCYQVLIGQCFTKKLEIEIELRDFTWKNMDKVQNFFSKVFPMQYHLYHFVEMMYGDLVKVAFHGKEVIGFLYSHTYLLDTKVFIIGSIGCSPKYRRQGVGSYLFEHALNFAEKKGTYEIIRLYTQTHNTVALKFYKKYGFKIVGEEPDYYNNVADTDAYKMEKIIRFVASESSTVMNETIEQKQFTDGKVTSNATPNRNNTNVANLETNLHSCLVVKLKDMLHERFG